MSFIGEALNVTVSCTLIGFSLSLKPFEMTLTSAFYAGAPYLLSVLSNLPPIMVSFERRSLSLSASHMPLLFEPSSAKFLALMKYACCARSSWGLTDWTTNLSVRRALIFTTSSCIGRNRARILVAFSSPSKLKLPLLGGGSMGSVRVPLWDVNYPFTRSVNMSISLHRVSSLTIISWDLVTIFGPSNLGASFSRNMSISSPTSISASAAAGTILIKSLLIRAFAIVLINAFWAEHLAVISLLQSGRPWSRIDTLGQTPNTRSVGVRPFGPAVSLSTRT